MLSIHLAILWRQKHTQFRGRGRKEHNVVGSKLWPTYAMKSVGLFTLVASVLCFLGGLVQINPVWLYGPFEPPAVSTAAQPDWYLGWTEGAIRLFPPWFLHIGSYSIPEVFWPAIVLPGITFALLYAWPFLEARVTHDHAEHHLLDRPSDRPVRTAIGAGVLTFFVVLTAAGGQDIIAAKLQLDIVPVTSTLRVLVFVLPLLVAAAAWKICRDLKAGGFQGPRGAHRTAGGALRAAGTRRSRTSHALARFRAESAATADSAPRTASHRLLERVLAALALVYAWLSARRARRAR